MKKRFLLIFLLILVTGASFAQTHTLKVTVPDTTMVCYAAGSFNGWNTSANPMTKISDSPKVFTLDIEVASGDVATSEYRYLSGPDWKYEQTQAANFKLSGLDADGDTVDSFKAIYDTGQESDVTINVLVPAELFVCYLTGSFNGWNSVTDPMNFVDSTVNGKEFTLTIHTLDTTTLEYKFLSGPGWSYEQTSSTNYNYMTDGGTVVCDQFKAIYDPSKVGDVTINITVPAGTAEAWVVGSWNSWSMGGAVQATKNLDGTFTAMIPMVADFEYKIWCHNDWPYEEAKDTAGNSLDANRTASFETGPVFDITVAFWKQLYDPELHLLKVIVPDTVKVCYVSGSFNGWSTTADTMTKVSDIPKVFTLEIRVAVGDVATTEYRYLSGPDWKYEQTQAANFKLSGLDADGDTVDSFKAIYDPGQESDVTINVLVPAELFVCYLTGSFNGWNSVIDPMNFVDSTANGKEFTLTIHTLDTTTLEFKFLSGPGWSYEQTNSTNYNYMTDGGTVVCDQFKAIYNPSKVGDVTINITVPAGTAEAWVVGSWNSWSMGGAVQATKNLDGTFTAMIPMVADFEYKIWCHNDWPYEEAKDAEGNSLDANRTASFETGPVFNITVAFWKQLYVSAEDMTFNNYRWYSQYGTIVVEGVVSGVTIFDLTGRLVEKASLQGTFVSKNLRTGIYIVRIDNQAHKIFVE